MEITKVVAIIGKPLSHSLSPVIHNAAFKYLNLDYNYIPLQITEDAIPHLIEVAKTSNFAGLNVTMPYKKAVISYLDEIDENSRLADAVNTVLFKKGRSFGFNTDINGIVNAIAESMVNARTDEESVIKNKSALIIGAGGAARAAAISLIKKFISEIIIVNRTEEKANEFIKILSEKHKNVRFSSRNLYQDIKEDIDYSDIIINATPIGMYPDEDNIPLSIDYDLSGKIVMDLIYRPVNTKFLKKASMNGARIISGDRVFLSQAAASFEIWLDNKAPVEIMKEVLDKALAV